MINYFDKKNPDDRLNAILDKISKVGIRKLNKDEKLFLESYSAGKELEINELLSNRENEKTFISDDGNFIFKLDNIEYIDDVQYINGILIVPDLILTNKKIIKGELKGSVIVFIDGNLSIDFHNGRHDVFEFVGGLEYELDCFMDDLINKISNEKSNN